ncbi:MAG: four helix bundle protein [Candidatus Omnitrophota bacterium]
MNEKKEKIYDIRERTFKFALRIIKIVSRLPRNREGSELAKQIIRSGTSVGANIEEAMGSRTKKEFTNCMNIAKRESRETRYWLRLIMSSDLLNDSETKSLLEENEEILKVLTSIVKTSEKNL